MLPKVRRMTLHQVLQRGGNKKVLLAQTQFSPRRCVVARIKHLGNCLGPRHPRKSPEVVPLVEHVEMQRIDGASRPQPQPVNVPAAPPDDRRIVGHRLDGLLRMPDRLPAALSRGDLLQPAAKLDVVNHLGALEFPGIAERQPLLGMLLLPAVLDDLPKEAMVVTDPVAAGGDAEARHAFHKTRGKTPEAAIAEGCVRFGAAHPVRIDAEIAQRNFDDFTVPQVADNIVQQPADQKFQRHVVDALAAFGIADALRREPAVDDAVAQCERRRDKPVPVGRVRCVFADRQGQFGEQRRLEIVDVAIRYRHIRQRRRARFRRAGPGNVHWHVVGTLSILVIWWERSSPSKRGSLLNLPTTREQLPRALMSRKTHSRESELIDVRACGLGNGYRRTLFRGGIERIRMTVFASLPRSRRSRR